MKKLITIAFILILPFLMSAQYFEIRAYQSDLEYLYVQMRDTTNSGLVSSTAEIVDMQFEIRWPKSLGADVDVEAICTYYDMWSESLGYRGEEDDFYYRVFSAYPVGQTPYQDWIKNEWQTLVKLKVTSASSGSGNFEPASYGWVVEDLNLNINGTDYDVHVAGGVPTYPYPTLVYHHVWQGGDAPFSGFDEYSWGNGLNWVGPCGDSQYGYLQPPADTSNCAIPGNLTYYPTNFNNTTGDTISNLRMQPGSLLIIPSGITLVVLKNARTETGSNLEVMNGGKLDLKDQ